MGFLDDLIAKSQKSLDDKPSYGMAEDAVKHDLYESHMFRELLDEAPALDELVDELGREYDYTDDMIRDVMMEFFQGDPHIRDRREMDPGRLHNHAVVTDLEATPETRETRGLTRHDRYGSALATISVTEKIKETLENLPDDLEQQAEEAQQQQQQANEAREQLQQLLEQAMDLQAPPMPLPGDKQEGGSQPNDDAEDGEADGEEEGAGGSDGDEGDEGSSPSPGEQAMADALSQALNDFEDASGSAAQATEQVESMATLRGYALKPAIQEGVQQANEQLGAELDTFASWGVEDGIIQNLDFEERKRLLHALQNNRISEFMDLVGRFRFLVQAEHTKHVEYGRDEMYDAELSDRLPDVMGSELAKRINRHMRLDFLNRLADRALLSKKYRGLEKAGRGALVFVGDVSGSMTERDKHGITREAWMKAFMLAMLLQAKLQRRDFVIILFSSANQQKKWHFPKGNASPWELLEAVGFFFNGGTNFEVPLGMASDLIEEEFNRAGTERADIIFCTDDDCSVSANWLSKFHEKKERVGFRVFGIAIGCRAGSALQAVSTPNYRSMTEFQEPSDVVDLIRAL